MTSVFFFLSSTRYESATVVFVDVILQQISFGQADNSAVKLVSHDPHITVYETLFFIHVFPYIIIRIYVVRWISAMVRITTPPPSSSPIDRPFFIVSTGWFVRRSFEKKKNWISSPADVSRRNYHYPVKNTVPVTRYDGVTFPRDYLGTCKPISLDLGCENLREIVKEHPV